MWHDGVFSGLLPTRYNFLHQSVDSQHVFLNVKLIVYYVKSVCNTVCAHVHQCECLHDYVALKKPCSVCPSLLPDTAAFRNAELN